MGVFSIWREVAETPHIWGQRVGDFSNIRATFPQFMWFIHSFQQVIHRRQSFGHPTRAPERQINIEKNSLTSVAN